MSSKISNKTLGGIFAVLVIIFLFLFVWNGEKNERSFREELVTIDSASVTEIIIFPKAKQHGEIKLFKEDERVYRNYRESKMRKISLCHLCQWNWGPAQPDRCRAFPKGIPDKYMTGQVIHQRIVKDQKGNFVFKYFERGC